MEAIDETLLNDDNDEDLDYDLDPKEENALLQEETDFVERESEDEDVLDINVDYDQMDVTDDKIDSAHSDKSRSEKKFRKNSNGVPEKKNIVPMKNYKSDRSRNLSRVHKRSSVDTIANRAVKKSKTVLINPRFRGPVRMNSRNLAWDTPPPILNNIQTNQQYIQPWSSGIIPNQTVPQIPVNNYNSAPFVPNNSYTYMQQQQHMLQQQQQMFQPQHFAQPQHFMNPLPMMNQPPIQNIPQQPVLQMDNYNNNYQAPPIPQIAPMQQIPEAPKRPVHQRLGIPMNNYNQPPSIQMGYNNNQPVHNPMPFENNDFNHFNPTTFSQHPQMGNNGNQIHMNNNQYSNKKYDNFHHQNYNRKQPRKFTGNPNVTSNRVLLSPSNGQNEKNHTTKSSQPGENVQSINLENSTSSNIVVVPEDEDDETRQYRIKIEEQKRKREEVLRKKEENRLKNVSNPNIDIPSTVVHNVINHVRTFKPKKVNYQHRPQQNFVKPQVNTNNIVITGNDDQCYFKSRQNRNMGNYNKGYKSPSLRIVTAEPIFASNINSKIEDFEKEVDSKSLSSFLSDRVVSTQDNLMQTNIVVIKNLATATTEPKIMKLCGGVGSVQKLQMDTKERQATIHFDTVASAHKFFNKYRRYMIDLSMIQVDLLPCEGSL